MTITVLSKPSCVQCNATYRALDSAGLEYEVYDLTSEDPKAAELYAEAKARNFLSAPVVWAGDQVWAGFKPEKIDEVAALVA